MEFLDDQMAAYERLHRQRKSTVRELQLSKRSTEGWVELHKAEIARLDCEIALLEEEML